MVDNKNLFKSFDELYEQLNYGGELFYKKKHEYEEQHLIYINNLQTINYKEICSSYYQHCKENFQFTANIAMKISTFYINFFTDEIIRNIYVNNKNLIIKIIKLLADKIFVLSSFLSDNLGTGFINREMTIKYTKEIKDSSDFLDRIFIR